MAAPSACPNTDVIDDIFHRFEQSAPNVVQRRKKKATPPEKSETKFEHQIKRQYDLIAYQGQQYEKKKKNPPPPVEHNDSETMYNTMQTEINQTLASKGWRSMEMCFKWKYIQEYLEQLPRPLHPEDLQKLKQCLMKDKSFLQNVVFDKSSRSVKKLHFICSDNQEI